MASSYLKGSHIDPSPTITTNTSPSELMQTLRKTQYPQLSNVTYLDYTASAPFPQTLPETHLKHLQNTFQSNPHSESPPSTLSTNLLQATRQHILTFFNASDDYTVIFTANATAATKLVGEAFPFRRRSRLILSQDNHNSVLGIRCFAKQKHARISYIPLSHDFRLVDVDLPPVRQPSLLAYPAQSNFSGVRHGTDLLVRAKKHGYFVLYDAAALVPTSKMDLSATPADYVPISFYKMFGYPTGVGALIVRKDALNVLTRPAFSGGTVEWVSIQGKYRLVEGVEAFHDGTPDFLGVPAVMSGLLFLNRIGMEIVHDWVHQLTGILIAGLARIRNAEGRRMVVIYGPELNVRRGGTVAFDIITKGRRIRADVVESELAVRGVCVRAGCFCNPGCGEHAIGGIDGRCARGEWTKEEISRCVGRGLGFVRVSLGLGAVEEDIVTFLDVLKGFCERVEAGAVEKPFWEVENSGWADLRWRYLRRRWWSKICYTRIGLDFVHVLT